MNIADETASRCTGQGLSRRRILQAGTVFAVSGVGFIPGGRALASTSRHVSQHDGIQTVYASSFGFDSDDATAAIQQALDADADIVVIDDVGAEWLTRPLSVNRDNVCVVVQPGVTVRAKPQGFPGTGDHLFNIFARAHVSIIGYGATFAMNKQEYIDLGDGSQSRMAIYIASSTDISIEGLTITGAGGDGIYVGRARGADMGEYASCSTDITIRNVRCDDNYRNGLSVISVDGLLVEGCSFVNSSGHNPQAGIDFEPNLPDEQLSRVIIRDCVLEDNAHANLLLSLQHPATYAAPMDMLFDRVRIGKQTSDYQISLAFYGPSGIDPGGLIEVRDSLIDTGPGSCSTAIVAKQPDGALLKFTRTESLNWGNVAGPYQPLCLLASGREVFGGVTWDDCLMITDQTTPFLARRPLDPGDTQVQSVHGSITVVDPNGVTTDLGANASDVTLAVRALNQTPATVVGVRALRPTVCKGAPITLLFTRESSDLSAPLAIRYSLGGSAVERVDLDGTSGTVVIPPGATTARAAVATRRLAPEGTRTVVVTIVPMLGYSVGDSSSTTVTVVD